MQWTAKLLFVHGAKGHIHEGRLVPVPDIIGNKADAYLARLNLWVKLVDQIIGSHGAANSAANYDDILCSHFVSPVVTLTSVSTTDDTAAGIIVRRVRKAVSRP